MIRRLARRVARRVRARGDTPPRPAPPPRPTPPPPEPEEEPELEVDAETAAAWRVDDEVVHLLDIREPRELQSGHAVGAILIPMNQVPTRLAELPRDGRLIVYCAAGARSFGVTSYLREQGFAEAWSLEGGLGSWSSGGGAIARPPRTARFPLTSRVRITRDPLVTDDGIAVPESCSTGTVQHIEEAEAGPRYTIGLLDEEGIAFRIAGIEESELARP